MVNVLKLYFEDLSLNYAPILEAVLRDPLRDKSAKLKMLIDTGFQGGVLIPLHVYLALNLSMFEELKTTGITAVGSKVELRTSRVIVEIGNLSILTHAYTGLGVKKSLIGREVLKETGFTYKPPKELRLNL